MIPEISSKPSLTIPVERFRDALGQVVVAASLDESRPVLAGVYLHIEDGVLIVAATDSYRLAERRIKLKGATGDLSIIVPVRTMQELVRILGDTQEELKVYVGDNQVMFEVDNIELTSRLIEGQFPNYQQIIPESEETSIEIDVAEFSRIVKVASLFARENAGSVRIDVKSEGLVNVVSSASQVGENTSSAECMVLGDDGEVSLNARYLIDALSVIKSARVNFSISGKLSACVLRPAEKDDAGYLHLIMPLRT
jgi:DNA polymerase-3 subunit beta